ncbi:kinase subunit of RNA polymerase II carboxy-terminal domain kinase I [Tulasnella sp. 403]|nr:kinase subunit of RNA polymerase II carboxy-terminal domain kinase I [Tulasnella sp. 403]
MPQAIYERSRSSRDRRDHRYDDEDLMMPVADDDYYRSRAHRDQVPQTSSRSHHRDADSPPRIVERHYVEPDRPRHSRARSPYPSDDRWQPREKVVAAPSRSSYTAVAYDRPHDDGYSRRVADEHYRAIPYPDDAWPPHPALKDREEYRSASANYASWDRHSTSYALPPDRDERLRDPHPQHPVSVPPNHSHSRRAYDHWPDEERLELAGVPVDRRVDSREWARRDLDMGPEPRYLPDHPPSRSADRGWEPRPSYHRDPSPQPSKIAEPKFAPGPRWKGDDTPSQGQSKNSGQNSWKGKGQYERKKKDRDHVGRKHGKTNDHEYRERDNGYQNKKSSAKSKNDRKSRKRRRSVSRSQSARSRSRSNSPVSYSHAQLSVTSSPKRRRKGSSSPDRSERNPRKHKGAVREPSPSSPPAKYIHPEEERGREQQRGSSQHTRSRSASRQRSRSPPSSPNHRARGRRDDDSTLTSRRKGRSRSSSRSRSPSSSPQTSLRQNGTNGASVKHRLPPSGPRAVDFRHAKIQRVESSLSTFSSRSNVAAAYQRRYLGGEPPPIAPRAEYPPPPHFASANAPITTKGMYPPPQIPSHPSPVAHDPRMMLRQTEGSTSVLSGPLPLSTRGGPSTAPIQPGSAMVKKWFPGDDEDSDSRPETPALNDMELRGGGKGFGIIPARSKHPSGRPKSPLGVYPPPSATSDPGKASRAIPAFVPSTAGSNRDPSSQPVETEKDGFPVTALREIKLLQSLSHQNVIFLHEMMVSKGNVYMVFDYMEHDLTGVLHQSQFTFTAAHLKSLCHQMLSGLAYLHHKGVIHRDMKGSNILVNSRGELKLADFGLARVFQKRRKNDYTNRVITLWYRPPELLLGATVYGPEVDMWSAGTIMLELFTKKPIFQGADEIHQLEVIYRILGTATPEIWPALTDMPWYELVKPTEIHKNYFRVAFQKYLSPAALDLAEGLLTYDPEKRATALEALNTPYFLEEDPPMEQPIGLAAVEGEWHELDTKRERDKSKKRRKPEGTAANGTEQVASAPG